AAAERPPRSMFACGRGAAEATRPSGRLESIRVPRQARASVRGGEALPPARVAESPAELALRLLVRGAAHVGHEHDAGLAGHEAGEPARYSTRRLGADRLGQEREPLAHRRGLVVDDVVDALGALLEGEHGGRRGVLEVDERPDTAAVADD